MISTSSANNLLAFDLAAAGVVIPNPAGDEMLTTDPAYTGITFDLNQTNGKVQTVDSSGDMLAFTALPTLIGSSYDDT